MNAATQPGRPVRTALFVDFDNIYIGLKNIHPKAAEEFATNPRQWLTWFEQGMPNHEVAAAVAAGTQWRAILLRHCYLNPTTFGNYRAYFTRSAFRVVDCPPLTGQNKNSTDIHMVMDILDAMRHETRFDEFIILSGDSDFTPVLLRLRNHDRRTVILTTGPVAQAYKAAADQVVGVDSFVENGLGILPKRVESAAHKTPATAARPAGTPAEVAVEETLREKILAYVARLVADSTEPVDMATAASQVIKALGSEVQETKWAGAGTFKKLLTAANGRGFELVPKAKGPGYLLAPSQQAAPISDYFAEKWKGQPEELAAFARRVNNVTGTPLLTPDSYAVAFKALEEELRENSYFLTDTSRAVRDRCGEHGSPVARKAINSILQGITYAGHKFQENPLEDTAEVFADVFKKNVLTLCKGAQLLLSDEELGLLNRWIQARKAGGQPTPSKRR